MNEAMQASLRRHLSVFGLLFLLLDQAYDLVLVVELIILGQFWFAILLVVLDFLPAMVFIIHSWKTEKSWKVIVSGTKNSWSKVCMVAVSSIWFSMDCIQFK